MFKITSSLPPMKEVPSCIFPSSPLVLVRVGHLDPSCPVGGGETRIKYDCICMQKEIGISDNGGSRPGQARALPG